MSVRIRAAAAALIAASFVVQIPVFAQGTQTLTTEEKVAAQNFNGIDIAGDSLGTVQNSGNNGAGQNFNQGMNGNQSAFNNSMSQNSLSSQLTSQNTQLGQVNAFGGNNGCSNNNNNNNMNGNINGMNSMNNNGMNAMNSNMNGSFNNGMNAMNGGMIQNQSDFANNNNNNMSNGMNNNGGIVQSIGNCIMSDPQMMQRAVGVAGAAALLGVFVSSGGVGGMMRSAGLDNTRHIRGSVVGY